MPLKLRPFQNTGVDFLTRNTEALLADEMGLGKTPQAIVAAEAVEARRVLIVCPASVKLNWLQEWMRWTKRPEIIPEVIFGAKASIPTGENSIVIVNYDLLIRLSIYKQITALKWDVGIFDEAHYLKGRNSQRTKAVLLRNAIASRCRRKWFLTGTPVLNRPVEIYPLLKACSPKTIDPYLTYTAFAKHFCGGYWDGLAFKDRGATHVDELNSRLNQSFMLRRLKVDVLPELPDKQYQIIPFKIEKSAIQAMVAKEFTWAKGDVKYHSIGTQDGAEMALVRHEIALSKVPQAIKHIGLLMDSKEKLVVFAYHRDVIASLKKGLSTYRPVVVQGRMTAHQKQKSIDNFQGDPECRIFIGQITAAGIGISLTAADMAVFVETTWVPGEIDQAVDRIHRIGQDAHCLIQFLVVQDSLESYMLREVILKRSVVNRIVKPLAEDIFQ